jgi:excinuclease UvrABC nuclease subunit
MVPDEPGYYAFTDHNGALTPTPGGKNVLYVGIATQSLRKRISKYKTGDTASISNLHKGGFLMFLSRATAHFHDGKLTHSVQRTPVTFTRISAGQPPQHGVLEPDKIYLRWSVDHRAAIEALLIRQLNPKYNTMLVGD